MNVLGVFSLPVWLVVLIITLSLAYVYFSWNFDYWKNQNVKTSFYVPFLGSLWRNPFSPVHEIDIKSYKSLGKIWGTYEFRDPVLLVADLNLIKQIAIKEFHNFPHRRRFPLGKKGNISRLFLSVMDGDEEWKFHRSILSQAFTSGKLRKMENLIEESGDQMINYFHRAIQTESNDMDVKNGFGLYGINVIASCCFGYKLNVDDADDVFEAHVKQIFKKKLLFIGVLMMLIPKLTEIFNLSIFEEKSVAYFEKVLRQVVAKRKSGNFVRNDFLQILLDAQRENEGGTSLEKSEESTEEENQQTGRMKSKFAMNEEAIVAHSILFLIAGFDTTANSICLAVYLLALNSKCQDKLAQEIDETLEKHGKLSIEVVMGMRYLDMVISESLRYFPPASRLERRCNKNCNLGDIRLMEGMIVAVPIYSIHHSEEYYPNPERFDPERFTPEKKAKLDPATYMPFGSGPRNCIGMRFAMMEFKMALAKFFSQFRVSPSSETQIPMKFRPGILLLLPTDGIHLKVEKRRT